jgi:hypothetical protein
MILTFREMAINIADYNGMRFDKAERWIINKACDYVMHTFYPHQNEHDIIPDANIIRVDIVMQTVTFPGLAHTLH